ncbi:MAG: Calx-beta domain-containing protein, partial [Pseudoflavonifractor sp.]
MRSIGKKLLAMTLTLAILISTVPAQVFAYMAPKSENLSVVDKNGKTIAEDDSWEQTFPYGAFAFEHASLANAEGEDGIIKVYRLGGTAGRATAFLTYEPVLTQNEDGTTIDDYAISSDDIEIKVEEPQPAAKYQPVGKVPDPKSSKATVKAVPDEKGYTLNLSVTAEQYQWQILNNGVWENILDATAATVPADKEFVDGSTYDYRCLYTEKAVQYCSSSMRGEVYVAPAEEVLEPMPDGINLSADPVYTPLDMKSAAEGPFAGWAFELIFADGEWVKEIHLSSLLDALPEAQEAATFTIRDCEGGQVLESANTLLMSIRDINEPEPSTLGFAVSAVTVDKADGTAEVMIERVGGSQRPVTVEYTTQDGTALAGTDYVKVSLIDDGIPTTEPKQFDIVLSQILGDDGCTLSQGTVRVDLINSAKAVAPNLATQLYDPQAVDVSDNVPEAEGAANQNSGPAEGVQVPMEEPESVYSQLDFGGGDSEISPMVYDSPLANIVFQNPVHAWDGATDAANRDSWKMDNEAVVAPAMSALYRQNETAKDVGEDWNWTSDEFIDRGVALVSTTENGARLTDAGWNEMGGSREVAGQMYRGYNVMIKTRQGHDTSRLSGSTYYYSFTRPRLHLDQGSNGHVSNPRYVLRFRGSPANANWTIRAADTTQNPPLE